MITLRRQMFVLTVGVGCAMPLALAGCTSGHKTTPSTSVTSSKAPSSPSRPALTPASSIPPPTGNVVSLFKTVTMSSCEAAPGGWKAAGTIHNTTGKAHGYQILVYFTTDQATVIDSADTTVSVATGQSATWHASAKFKTAPKMRCVIVSVK